MNKEQPPAVEQEKKSQAQQDYEKGVEYLQSKEAALAANALHNALVGFEQEENESGIANASDRLADICAERGDLANALAHCDRAYAICLKHKDRLSLLSLEKKKAALLRRSGELAKAASLYLDILDEYGILRNPQGSVDTLEILAEIYLAMNQREKAAESYRMAARIHESFKHKRHAEALREKAAEVEAA